MSSPSESPLHYDRRTIRLHWLTATLVVLLWTLGQTIDWFPKGPARSAARSTHLVLGISLAIVIGARLWWRTTAGRRLPRADAGWLGTVAVSTHRLLYLLLCTTVLLGLANAWVRGDNLFTLIAFPSYDPANKALRGWLENWHGLSADALVILSGVHACAGLLHHYVLRNTTLLRMRFERTDR